MPRRTLPALLLLAALPTLGSFTPPGARAQKLNPSAAPTPQWVWFDEGNPLADAPAGERYFRRTFTLDKPFPADSATLEITADNHYAVWLNGTRVGSGDEWSSFDKHDVKKLLVKGINTLAVEGRNDGGPAGLVVRLTVAAGKDRFVLVSDKEWKSASDAPAGWQKADFADAKWGRVRVLGALGKVGPWAAGGNGGGGGGPRVARLTVPEGYTIEPIVKNPGDRGPFSLVNMTFDGKGRLLVSDERGGTLLCTKPDEKGVLQQVSDYCPQVKGVHGMCWYKDALYVVGNGPQGTGLYRGRDTEGADVVDEVKLLHRFEGGMGEHGPHAVFPGPDGNLYVVVGNHAFARIGPKLAPNPEKLADNSPLRRWPTGGQGPDQGKAGSTEDVLLPRLNDANGHAANLRAPGGTIWRMTPEGREVALVAAGFRNQFDAAFNAEGELFSYDSDMEWDEGLPWYRAVRAVHCPPGADFVWRTGAANTPNYYLDSLPPLVETGRGSPVGVTFCNDARFGARSRRFFMADWSIGVVYAVHLTRKGGSYAAKAEKFCVGSPLPVTDLEFGPDGCLYLTYGGRGTQGGVYRVVPPGWKPGLPTPAPANPARRAAPDSLEDQARVIYELGVAGKPEAKAALLKALTHGEAWIRRRACEALVRAGIEPDVKAIWPLLADDDHHVATAARLVLERIDPAKWAGKLADEKHDRTAYHAIIALAKTGQLAPQADAVFARLNGAAPRDAGDLLGFLRTAQLACFHAPTPPDAVKALATRCDGLFPHADPSVNRELAILLAHFRRTKALDADVPGKLLAAMQASASDRPQQIHYFYCLRVAGAGWTPAQKAALVAWYDNTRDWNGGNSYRGFLANIYRQCLEGFGPDDLKLVLAGGLKHPHAALPVVQLAQQAGGKDLLPALEALAAALDGAPKLPRGNELRAAVGEALVRGVTSNPDAAAFPALVRGLRSTNKALLFEVVAALRKCPAKPKPDDPAPFRAALEAAARLDAGNRWPVVELLRHWTAGRAFGAEKGDWKGELSSWSRWFAQTFPKEPSLPDAGAVVAAESKYKYSELLSLVQGAAKGDAAKGRKAFEKALCARCHKYGKEGEALGPDLTNLAKRFKRADVLESLVYPSKVISDQYRSATIETTKGQQLNGLVAVQGETLTVLQSDGNKVTLAKKEVEKQYASLVSVMPEKLLDLLTREEIADLFAFLESDPGK